MARLPLLPFLLLTACSRAFGPAEEAAIRAVMAEQEAAWDAGDIPGFMRGCADTVVFVGRRGTTRGRDAVTENYLRNYPDREAMGALTFTLHEVVPAGRGHAWATGGWTLHRAADTLSGGFSLLWVEGPEGWRIARDHSY